MQRLEQATAATMTVASVTAVGTWISTATDIVQLIAGTTAVVVAVYTALYYRAKWKNERSITNDSKRSSAGGPPSNS